MTPLEQTLRRLGVDAASLGASRMRDLERVEPSRLAEEIVVPETWFFRGGDLFSWLVRHLPRPFRALSLPCSTGEEPYSLAIACAEAGIHESRIVGVDVSADALAKAELAKYGTLSFRQMDDETKRAWFHQGALVPEIRRRVEFRQGNLLDPSLLRGEAFDLVLCRNLFIYLTPEARRTGLDNLARLVKKGGLLGMGHAEPLPLGEKRFARHGPSPFFLYRREELSSPELPVAVEPLRDPLARAQEAADAGRIEEALELVRRIEARSGPTARTQALLGVLHQARHESTLAAHHFHRALNLDPSHREAAMHLLILCQQAGDHAAANVLRRRLSRMGGEE